MLVSGASNSADIDCQYTHQMYVLLLVLPTFNPDPVIGIPLVPACAIGQVVILDLVAAGIKVDGIAANDVPNIARVFNSLRRCELIRLPSRQSMG
jgi:hypothetical protein